MKAKTPDTWPIQGCQKWLSYTVYDRFIPLNSEDLLQKCACRRERNQLGLTITYCHSFLAHRCYVSLLTISDAVDIFSHTLTHVTNLQTHEVMIQRDIISLADLNQYVPCIAVSPTLMDLKYCAWPLHTHTVPNNLDLNELRHPTI